MNEKKGSEDSGSKPEESQSTSLLASKHEQPDVLRRSWNPFKHVPQVPKKDVHHRRACSFPLHVRTLPTALCGRTVHFQQVRPGRVHQS